MSYQHLSLEERHYIEISIKIGKPYQKYTKHSFGHKESAITREVARNKRQRSDRHH